MNKINGSFIAASRLESGDQATCGIVFWTTAKQKDEIWRCEDKGRVVVERKADHDARELRIEQLCEQIGQLRIDLAAREAEVERLRDVERRRVAEGMSAWCSPRLKEINEHDIQTHHAPHMEEAPWLAIPMKAARELLAGYDLTEDEKNNLPAMMVGYCRLLDESGIIFEGDSEREVQDAALDFCRSNAKGKRRRCLPSA